MEEIKKKTEEIIQDIELYIIDNLNVGYEIKTEMLKKIIRYCEGPENQCYSINNIKYWKPNSYGYS